MMDKLSPICTGCQEEPGTHYHSCVKGFFCDNCADLFLPLVEPAEPDPESPDYYIGTDARNLQSYGVGRP